MKRIAFLTDAHIGQKIVLDFDGIGNPKMAYLNESDEHKDNLKAVLEDIVKKGIPEIVFGGDIGSKESNEWFFKVLDEYPLKYSIILGNHDTFSEVAKYCDIAFTRDEKELKYAKEDDYVKYIFLDTSSNSVSNGQLLWLKKELDTEKTIIIFMHHPVLKLETPIDDQGAALNRREEVKQVLQELKNDVIIFCGHYHMEDETTDKNITQFVTPACSYQIEKQTDTIAINTQLFGYRIISINNSTVNTNVVICKERLRELC